MKPERKLWHELKRITPKISWTRIENTSLFGTPDLLGYNVNGHFFTVELKITSDNKSVLAHQLRSTWSIHTTHHTVNKPEASQGSCKLFPGTCILALEKEGFKNKRFYLSCRLMLAACIFPRLVLDAWGLLRLLLVACNFRLYALGACSLLCL